MAAERIDESTLEEMEETMMLTAFHEEQGHYDQLFKLDSRFHSLLYEACKSKILEHELKIFHQYVQQVRKNALKKKQGQNSPQKNIWLLWKPSKPTMPMKQTAWQPDIY